MTLPSDPKYLLVSIIGQPIAAFNKLERAFKIADKLSPIHDKFDDIQAEMKEDGDVLLDNGMSIYRKKDRD